MIVCVSLFTVTGKEAARQYPARVVEPVFRPVVPGRLNTNGFEFADAYFTEGCMKENRIKIYCYIAACGLLWSNWCEYKLTFGVEFGEYALAQFRFAKDYYRLAVKEMENE